MPPIMTPTASAMIGSRKKSRSVSVARIMAIFRMTGERAGAAKCLSEFRIPMQSATREIKKI